MLFLSLSFLLSPFLIILHYIMFSRWAHVRSNLYISSIHLRVYVCSAQKNIFAIILYNICILGFFYSKFHLKNNRLILCDFFFNQFYLSLFFYVYIIYVFKLFFEKKREKANYKKMCAFRFEANIKRLLCTFFLFVFH